MLLLCACLWGPGGLSAEELTLTEAIHLALKNNTDVVNATLDVSKAKARSASYRSFLFPRMSVYMLGSEQLRQVSFTVPSGSLVKDSTIGPIPKDDVHYTTPIQPTGYFFSRVSQPLSAIYRTRLNLSALDFSTQIAQQKVRSKQEHVARNVKQLYYNIEQTQSSLLAARETVKLDQEVKRVTGDSVAKQTALEVQLLQADANLADAEQSELSIENQQASLKEQLNDLLGRDVLTEFTVSPMGDAQNEQVDLVTARKRALAQRPEIQQSRLKTLQSEMEVRAKRAEYIPDIAAEFNTLTLLNFNSFLPGGSYSVGVSLSWEPFDWGRRKYEVAEKRQTVSQDKNTQASTERKVILDVDDKYRQVQQAWSKLHAASLGQRAAAENLRVGKNQYEARAALLQVVFQAQTTLSQANSSYYHALADYWTARADFERALGDNP